MHRSTDIGRVNLSRLCQNANANAESTSECDLNTTGSDMLGEDTELADSSNIDQAGP
jgi:hypothetical protein